MTCDIYRVYKLCCGPNTYIYNKDEKNISWLNILSSNDTKVSKVPL